MIHPSSPAAVFMRNYGLSLQEVSDVGALLLFLYACAANGAITDYRITARDDAARVETRGQCEGTWEAPNILGALRLAVAAITAQEAARSMQH